MSRAVAEGFSDKLSGLGLEDQEQLWGKHRLGLTIWNGLMCRVVVVFSGGIYTDWGLLEILRPLGGLSIREECAVIRVAVAAVIKAWVRGSVMSAQLQQPQA